MNERHDDLQEIIDAALGEMAAEAGDGFDPRGPNLAEFCRRTGLTRSRARTIKAHGFKALPHGNAGRRAAATVLTEHDGLVDDLLRKGVTGSRQRTYPGAAKKHAISSDYQMSPVCSNLSTANQAGPVEASRIKATASS